MAKYTGANLRVSVGGSLLGQTYTKSVTINESKDVHDSTGAGGGSKTFLGGEQSGTVSMDVWGDTVDTNVRDLFDLTDDDGVAVIVYPNGTGNVSISFSALWTAINEAVDKNGVVSHTVNGQITGAITRA